MAAVAPLKDDSKVDPSSSSSSNNKETGINYIKIVPDDSFEDNTNISVHEQERQAVLKSKEPETWGEIFKAWPKASFCILGNEFCEKFSYYGMRAVLTLYFLNILKLSDNISTVFFNGYTVLSSLTPLIGSVIADGFIGKFRTIFIVSFIFVFGQTSLAFASLFMHGSWVHPWIDLTGLIAIAISAGGIKPCISAFGGDQFEPHQTRMISLFFSVFYFSINIGSAASSIVAPIFRSMSCLGNDSCYPLAFGISAVLMIIATVIFILGSYSYKKRPLRGNLFAEVGAVVKGAIVNRNGPKRKHFLERYLNTHECENEPKCMELKEKRHDNNACHKVQLIKDVRSLISVLIMYLPVPMYWALYDQQGSVWLIQGIQMDCRIWGSTLLLPDQMQSINSLMILLFIPIFQIIIYPTVSKFVTITPLRKMVAGGILASLAFVSSGIVQLEINKTLPELPPENFGYVTVMNSLRQGCNFSGIGDNSFRMLAFNESLVNDKLKNLNEMIKVPAGKNIEFKFQHSCQNYVNSYTAPVIKSKKIYNLIVTELGAVILQINPEKPKKGTGEFSLSITMGLNDTNYVSHLALCRVKTDSTPKYPCDPTNAKDFHFYEVNYDDGKDTDLDSILPFYNNNGFDSKHSVSGYTFKAIQPGKWSFWYMQNMAKSVGMLSVKPEDLNITSTGQFIDIGEQGGVYAAVFTGPYDAPIYTINQIVPSNTVSILWQVPQFVIITLAEILFSITGYEFAYSQAAPSMKSLVQACWILTTAIGDSIIVLIAVLALFDNLATQFFVYAGAMLVVIFIFALLSIFYYDYKTYVGADSVAHEEDAVDAKEIKARSDSESML